jgi:hypothetical protein
MEAKFLLTTPGATAPTALVATMPLVLAGSLQGRYSFGTTVPDAGDTYTLSGSGRVGPLGKVTFSAEFGTPGFIASGHTTGTLTLASPRGTITLGLLGPTQPGFSAPPTSFTYTIIGGTGAFAHAHGSGHLTLTLTAQPTGTPGTLHHLGSGLVAIHFG